MQDLLGSNLLKILMLSFQTWLVTLVRLKKVRTKISEGVGEEEEMILETIHKINIHIKATRAKILVRLRSMLHITRMDKLYTLKISQWTGKKKKLNLFLRNSVSLDRLNLTKQNNTSLLMFNILTQIIKTSLKLAFLLIKQEKN